MILSTSSCILGKQTSVRANSAMIGFTLILKTEVVAPPIGFMVGVAGNAGDDGYKGATNIA